MRQIIEGMKEQVESVFDYLHANPEISWEEYNTTKYISGLMEKYGCKVTTFEDSTGVVGEIGKGTPVVAIRVDMDALWQEVNGHFQPNHSCGHDAHMTIGIGVLAVINEMKEKITGTLRFIFQPAEEKGNGALKMIEKKILDDVEFLYGLHLRPIQEVRFGRSSPAILHGAAQAVKGRMEGADTHAAKPHLGANAIEAAAVLVSELKGIHLDPMVPYSAKMTMFQSGGSSTNIIPGSARFSIDLRAQTNEAMSELREKVIHLIHQVSEMYSIEIKTEFSAGVVAAEVNETAKNFMELSIGETLGEENVEPPLVTSGGEDFHYYTVKRPHLKATMLGLGCDLKPGLHHPHMTFNKDALLHGVEILARTVVKTFEEQSVVVNHPVADAKP